MNETTVGDTSENRYSKSIRDLYATLKTLISQLRVQKNEYVNSRNKNNQKDLALVPNFYRIY